MKRDMDNVIKENEFLKNCNAMCGSNINKNESEKEKNDKTKEYEETLQKKSKEIYDLTVQLGSLKEENF